MEFLTSLVSAQTYYLRACLRMIVKLFLPGDETKCCIFPSNLNCLIFCYFINVCKSIENILLVVSSVTILRKSFSCLLDKLPPPPPPITPKGSCEISETLRRYRISKTVSFESCTKSWQCHTTLELCGDLYMTAILVV